MKRFLIIIILSISIVNCNLPDINIGESKEAKRLEQQNQLLSVLLLLILNSDNSELTFPNYKYSFSANREEIVNGRIENICVDVLIFKNLDPDKVYTGLESGRIDRQCERNDDTDFICMTDLTFYVGIHYFKKSENTFSEKRDFCREELKGIFVL